MLVQFYSGRAHLLRAAVEASDAGPLTGLVKKEDFHEVILEGEVTEVGPQTGVLTLRFARLVTDDDPDEYEEVILVKVPRADPGRGADKGEKGANAGRSDAGAPEGKGDTASAQTQGDRLPSLGGGGGRGSSHTGGSSSVSWDKPVKVRDYVRQDGTHVRAHTRSSPGSGGGRRR